MPPRNKKSITYESLEEKLFTNRNKSQEKIRENINEMREYLETSFLSISPDEALSKYKKLVVLIKKIQKFETFDNKYFLLATVAELTIALGWHLFFSHLDKKDDPTFQPTLSYILFAIISYNEVNLVIADLLFEQKKYSECEQYAYASYDVMSSFFNNLTNYNLLTLYKLDSLGHQFREAVLKVALSKIAQEDDADVEEFLLDYDKIMEAFPITEMDEGELKRQEKYVSLKQKLNESKNKKEKNRQRRQMKLLKGYEEELEKRKQTIELSHPSITDYLAYLQSKKELLDKRDNQESSSDPKIKEKIFLLTKKIVEEMILYKNLLHYEELFLSEILAEESTTIVSETIDEIVLQSLKVDLVPNVPADNSTISSLTSSEVSSPPDSLPVGSFEYPKCYEDDSTKEFLEYLSTVLDQYSFDAFLFGSANHTTFPNDFDILLTPWKRYEKEIMNFIGYLVISKFATVMANYEKFNRRVIKMRVPLHYFQQPIIVEFSFSNETAMEHAKRLDYTIKARHFDLRQKKMLPDVHPSTLTHMLDNVLHAVSDACELFTADPSIILRGVREMASRNCFLSIPCQEAISKLFAIRNLFEQINPDKLYREMVLLFSTGNAVKTLNILIYKLDLFQQFFACISQLNEKDYDLTLKLVYQVGMLSDNGFWWAQTPTPPSLLYYAVHWLVFIKDNLQYQHSCPRINLEIGETPRLNANIDWHNRNYLSQLENAYQGSPLAFFGKASHIVRPKENISAPGFHPKAPLTNS